MELFELLSNIADTNELAANFILVFAFFKWLHSQTNVTLNFIETTKEGLELPFTVIVKRCDLNAQNLTNVISSCRYGGGFLPADVRNQVIQITNPKNRYLI
jgi:hypothetical protein